MKTQNMYACTLLATAKPFQ